MTSQQGLPSQIDGIRGMLTNHPDFGMVGLINRATVKLYDQGKLTPDAPFNLQNLQLVRKSIDQAGQLEDGFANENDGFMLVLEALISSKQPGAQQNKGSRQAALDWIDAIIEAAQDEQQA